MRKTGAAVAAAVLTLVGPISATALPAQAVDCPDNNWRNIDGRAGTFFLGTNVNIRTGPSTQCGASSRRGQRNHVVQYHCFTNGEGGTWTHLYNADLRLNGWVRDTLLEHHGANNSC
jgi:hypothetical protein